MSASKASDVLRRLELAARRLAPRPSKEEAACCRRARDELGRPPIGFCGPDCERRPATGRPRER